jgi:hypothetical protein
MSAVYNLFLRQWKNGRITEKDLDEAVVKGLITEAEKQTIMGI